MTRTRLSQNARLAAVMVTCLSWGAVVSADEQGGHSPTPHDDYVRDASAESNTIGRSENVEAKLSAEFADFLGNERRASRVVEGLRTGNEFWLGGRHWKNNPEGLYETDDRMTSVDGSYDHRPPPEGGHRHNTIDPPTGTMGYGNVRLTLNLAEARLAQLGVSQPTNRELSAILVGGKIDGVPVEGILNERAAGAGWGEIAQRYDLKVGQIMGNGKGKVAPPVATPYDGSGHTSDQPVRTPPASSVAKGIAKAPVAEPGGQAHLANGYIPSGKTGAMSPIGASSSHGVSTEKHAARRNGYIPSGSSSLTAASNHGNSGITGLKGNGVKKNGYIPSGGSHARSSGIVSAQGSGMTGQGAIKSGHGNGRANGYVPSGAGGQSAGVISASNASVGASASSAMGQAHGKAQGKGHGKAK